MINYRQLPHQVFASIICNLKNPEVIDQFNLMPGKKKVDLAQLGYEVARLPDAVIARQQYYLLDTPEYALLQQGVMIRLHVFGIINRNRDLKIEIVTFDPENIYQPEQLVFTRKIPLKQLDHLFMYRAIDEQLVRFMEKQKIADSLFHKEKLTSLLPDDSVRKPRGKQAKELQEIRVQEMKQMEQQIKSLLQTHAYTKFKARSELLETKGRYNLEQDPQATLGYNYASEQVQRDFIQRNMANFVAALDLDLAQLPEAIIEVIAPDFPLLNKHDILSNLQPMLRIDNTDRKHYNLNPEHAYGANINSFNINQVTPQSLLYIRNPSGFTLFEAHGTRTKAIATLFDYIYPKEQSFATTAASANAALAPIVAYKDLKNEEYLLWRRPNDRPTSYTLNTIKIIPTENCVALNFVNFSNVINYNMQFAIEQPHLTILHYLNLFCPHHNFPHHLLSELEAFSANFTNSEVRETLLDCLDLFFHYYLVAMYSPEYFDDKYLEEFMRLMKVIIRVVDQLLMDNPELESHLMYEMYRSALLDDIEHLRAVKLNERCHAPNYRHAVASMTLVPFIVYLRLLLVSNFGNNDYHYDQQAPTSSSFGYEEEEY